MSGISAHQQLERVVCWHLPDPASVQRRAILDGLGYALWRFDRNELTVADCAVFVDLLGQILERYQFGEPLPDVYEQWHALLWSPSALQAAYRKRSLVERIYREIHSPKLERLLRERTGKSYSSPSFVYLMNISHWLWHVIADEQAILRRAGVAV